MALSVSQAASNQAVVNSGVNVNVDGSATNPLATTTAGHLLVLFSYQDKGATLAPAISDSAGQTWTLAGTTAASGNGLGTMWYRPNSAAVTSVSASWSSYSGAATVAVVVYEIAGAALNTPLDINSSNPAMLVASSSSTSLTSAALSTNNANDILIYGVGENVNQTGAGWAAGSGYTIDTGGQLQAGRAAIQRKIVAATQSSVTTSISWTSAGADRAGILAAFADTDQVAFNPEDYDSFNASTNVPLVLQAEPIISVW